MKILTVVGARPNFMKAAPLIGEMRKHADVEPVLVHTGQHYDGKMAGQFFEDLELPAPDVSLEVGSGSHAYQTGEVMRRLEPVLQDVRPDVVVVVGDVNSTLAAAVTAAKLVIPVAHVEAGLRSFDRTMPEEVNRLLTDAVSDELFVTEESGRRNLLREGIDESKIHVVGNVMIDALEQHRDRWQRSAILSRLGLAPRGYGVVTLHRPSTVDDPGTLLGVVEALREVARQLPLVFPVHPRTRQRLEAAREDAAARNGGVREPTKGICWLEPLGYLDFIALVSRATMVLTDSGGLQEETTALGVPCLTLRDRTERPVTVTQGTNRIVGTAPDPIVAEAYRTLEGRPRTCRRPYLWDGHAAERIVAILRKG
ncbi:MAG: non-hydrolyzing UDP-N-acetylglucosamine 2-epimerase, partial [Gemmatimonadota bacterium]